MQLISLNSDKLNYCIVTKFKDYYYTPFPGLFQDFPGPRPFSKTFQARKF